MTSLETARVPSPTCRPVGTSVEEEALLPGGHQTLVEKVLKLRAALFETRGIHISQVVGDVVHVQLQRLHAIGGAV